MCNLTMIGVVSSGFRWMCRLCGVAKYWWSHKSSGGSGICWWHISILLDHGGIFLCIFSISFDHRRYHQSLVPTILLFLSVKVKFYPFFLSHPNFILEISCIKSLPPKLLFVIVTAFAFIISEFFMHQVNIQNHFSWFQICFLTLKIGENFLNS